MPTSRNRKKKKPIANPRRIAAKSNHVGYIEDPTSKVKDKLLYTPGHLPQAPKGYTRTPIGCYGCGRQLPGCYLDTANYVPIDYYTEARYMCKTCAHVLESGDVIIRELSSKNETNGYISVINLSQNPINIPFWLDHVIEPGKINFISEKRHDELMKLAQDKLLMTHPLMASMKEPVTEFYTNYKN